MLAERVASSYRRALQAQMGPGEELQLQRGVGADAQPFPVNGWVTGYNPSDVVGAVQQGKRHAIVLASDVEASGFPVPILPKQDRLVWGGKTVVITAVDDATRRVQGALVAYELELAGA